MANDWISVEDRLPVEDGYYWAYNNELVVIAEYNAIVYSVSAKYEYHWWDPETKIKYFDVTHWMPIDVPVPPKENR